MKVSPVLSSRNNLLIGLLIYLVSVATLCGCLVLYGELSIAAALVDAVSFITLLAIGGIATWYFFLYLKSWQAHAVSSTIIIAICICVCFAILSLTGLENEETFTQTLPLRALVGASNWTILMLWYRIWKYTGKEMRSDERPSRPAPKPIIQGETLDRISVKDSGRIHIVPVKDILYIQASGDYVALCTAAGQFIKEQTMKYFDIHLSQATFVRIHRSTIVNVEHILRVELFGKDTYNVKLKNGANLRASIAGYRLLKERLNL